MKHIINDNHDNDEFTAEQFLQQHNFFIENLSQKLLKCIEHVYNNADELFKTREHIILQWEKKVSLSDQEFISENIICFASKNVCIRLDLKKEWNFHDYLNDFSLSQKLSSSWLIQRKIDIIINEMKSQQYTNSRTENITKMYNYNKSVFLHLIV